MHRGDPARTGVAQTTGPQDSPVVLWKFATMNKVQTSPAVAETLVFTSSHYQVYAVDLASGTKRWRFKADGTTDGASPAVSGGLVYTCDKAGVIYALDAATGAEQWRFATGAADTSSPAVVDGVAYVGSEDGNVYALDAASGAEL